ncbi:MAG: glycine cleavage system protein GcvH [Deltaproteobacteria bacterium]|nr:glycine cleavage system protein GcvH [Deltaproteobacteria bacterium]
MNIPKDLYYTKDHEWARIEGNTATIGITDHAQKLLGDIVFLEISDIGTIVSAGEKMGTIESVKAASDIFSPLSGKIIEVNTELTAAPDIVNKDPYGAAWMAKIEISSAEEVKALLNADAYSKLIEEESK